MDDADSNNDSTEQQECHLCSCRRAEINHSLEEIRRLKELAQKRLDEDYFKDDDAKVKYYTGLLYFVLLMDVLTRQLLPCLPQTGRKLSPFKMLLSKLMCHGWGGHGSDKHVTKKSGLLNKLLHGDLVLADRGFDTRDSVGFVCVCRNENTCIHKRTQPAGCKRCGGTAHLRVHVERVIGCVCTKYVDYTILNGLVPVSMSR